VQLSFDQLTAKLENSLSAVYLIHGEEPLQLTEAADAVRAAARRQGYAERAVLEAGRDFDWGTLAETGASLSLFSEKRLIDLRLNVAPGVAGGAALAEYARRPAPDTVLLITAGAIDRKTQQNDWYKALNRAGIVFVARAPARARLPAWIKQRARTRSLEIDADATELIADRVEGNLHAAAQEIEKLRLLVPEGRIGPDEVLALVADSARYDVFQILDHALAGRLARALRMLYGLRAAGAEAVAVHGALMWMLRRACREPAAVQLDTYGKTSPPRALPATPALLRQALAIERVAKGAAQGDAWVELTWLLARLAGKPCPS
jgi:DNA polymerase-3 subunit delta